jgi:hypothetical protein
MTITSFLIIGIVFLSILLCVAIYERTNFIHGKKKKFLTLEGFKYIYLVLFAALVYIAANTMESYLYPEDENIFRNVDYHVLSHKGYEIGNTFYLANGYTSEDEGDPKKSLWDQKEGQVLINGKDCCFQIREFTDPIYIRKKDDFLLVNPIIKQDVSNGFTLTNNNDTLYALQIEQNEGGGCRYISTIYKSDHSCVSDTSTFSRVIRQGYPLLDIIAQSPKIELTEDLENWFEGAYLVRTVIPMQGNTPNTSKRLSPLCIMPGISFYLDEDLRINNVPYDFKQDFIIPFDDYTSEGKVKFYSGIGMRKTETFSLSRLSSEKMRLEFLKPDMKLLKDTIGRVFINSSIDDVSKETIGSGYLYNKFAKEDNLNHINAHFLYGPSNARSKLSIKIVDLNKTEDELLDNDSVQYESNKEFLLHPRSQSPDAASWIFEVTDLRETNNLTGKCILMFIVCMFICIVIRVVVDSLIGTSTLSITELAVYVILFSFCVIRLILGWRTSTFIPTEDISLPMYIKMRASILDWCMNIVAISPLIVLCYAKWEWQRRLFFLISEWIKRHKNGTILFLFVISLIILWIGSHISLINRLCNIPLPLFCYFIYEIIMDKSIQEGNSEDKQYRIWASISMLGYLFVTDAGFAIIFLIYSTIHYLILDILYDRLKGWKYWFLMAIVYTLLWCILCFEGDIMIWLFEHAGWAMCIVGLCLLPYTIYLYRDRKIHKLSGKGTLFYFYFITAVMPSFIIMGILDATETSPIVTTILNSKTHMRYRAEIQKLSGDKKIDDVIQQCEFGSDDIIYIMRSAHNQWFINQYIRAGKKLEESEAYFHLQPHSNQGATYTTQTTDLVVTRYLLAEHGEWTIRWLLMQWLMLIFIFTIEFKMKERTNRIYMGCPILIFVISLMVYLSATNRIVFVGQDFPLISLQSKVAVLFPLSLLSLLIGRCIYLRSKETYYYPPKQEEVFKGLTIPVFLLVFSAFTLKIEQKGRDQEETQFNVSRLISDLSEKVEDINVKFALFQDIYPSSKKDKVKDIWDKFIKEKNDINKVYYDYLEPEHPDFFSTLLNYFNNKQISKTDINQLLHLRRRNGTCYLALNKQHYFIPAIMQEEARWTGDIFASKTESEMILFDHSKKAIQIDDNKDYEENIFLPKIKKEIPNMPLLRFDKKWVPGDEPLYLIYAKQGQSNSMFFDIEADTLEISGDGRDNQIATMVLPGDLLTLYKKIGNKKAQIVLNGNMSNYGTPYLVRNMWLNGHKRLFYPLGKEMMWTYHLGNIVSDVYSKDPILKDSTICLSLDYELSKAFYKCINNQIGKRITPPKSLAVLETLTKFRDKTYEEQRRKHNNEFYYNEEKNQIIVAPKIQSRDIHTAARLLNKQLKRNAGAENPLSKALDEVLKTQYDFTAVAIDGDGHIRAMFDYSRKRHLDPNNLSHLNRVVSELYKDGSNTDERDIFGSKALQYIPVGPASSFKPIAYTAITSQKNLNWESIDVTSIGQIEAQDKGQDLTQSGSISYAYYGGLELKDNALHIQGAGITHDKYLEKSNNLYHSVIILLGMQKQSEVERIMRPYTPDIERKMAFPVFSYNGKAMCFNPKEWYKEPLMIGEKDLLTDGLYYNFHILNYPPRLSNVDTSKNNELITNLLMGNDERITKLYDKGNSSRGWVFPEIGSLNNADRNISPLKVGFNQILLGADPLQQTPLQMAVNASRLASLNRADNITTILDEEKDKPYEFFHIDNRWTEQGYLDFIKRQVWTQLRNVPKSGTARALNSLTQDMENGKYGRAYYLYCKTGTLNDDRPNNIGKGNNRMKHLLVIITNRPLESVKDISELQKVRYYTLYLSYLGIEQNDFNINKFRPYIENVLNSNSFKNYMNPKTKNNE